MSAIVESVLCFISRSFISSNQLKDCFSILMDLKYENRLAA